VHACRRHVPQGTEIDIARCLAARALDFQPWEASGWRAFSLTLAMRAGGQGPVVKTLLPYAGFYVAVTRPSLSLYLTARRC
jgi:hypothetical protein